MAGSGAADPASSETQVRLENDVAQRVQPRLRMIYNGDELVNERRAALSCVVRHPPRKRSRKRAAEPVRHALPPWPGPARDARISTFVELEREAAGLEALAPGSWTRHGKLATAELTLGELRDLAGRAGDIAYVTSGDILQPPDPMTRALHVDPPARIGLDGAAQTAKVLVGIVDVGGFDFAHPEFIDAGRTRFERIWDQGLPSSPGSRVPYGSELTRQDIDLALEWQRRPDGLAATELLVQSAQVPGSHATHVASLAAGNHGVCPGAVLAGVSVAIPSSEQQRRHSFFDSTRLAHAVDYLDELAAELDLPLVINISLGTNGHAHDGSSPINRWIERILDEPGRCVVCAAGNAGQEAPRFEGDVGFVSGRIHSSGRIEATGLERDLEWVVLGGDIEDLSENEMEIWYEPQDELEVEVRPPGSSAWLGPIGAGSYLQNHLLESNTLVKHLPTKTATTGEFSQASHRELVFAFDQPASEFNRTQQTGTTLSFYRRLSSASSLCKCPGTGRYGTGHSGPQVATRQPARAR